MKTHFLAFLMLTAMFWGCKPQKDVVKPTDKTTLLQKNPLITEAQKWYQGQNIQITDVSNTNSRSSKKSILRLVDWSTARQYKHIGKDVVEVDIDASMDNKKIAYALSKTENPQSRNIYPSITRLVMYKRRTGEGFDSYMMIGVAKEQYAIQHPNQMKNNQQNRWDSDFSGWILFFDLQSQFINGYELENGMIKTVGKKSKQEKNNQRSGTPQGGGIVCGQVWVHVGWDCDRGDTRSTESDPTPCPNIVEIGYWTTQCWQLPDPSTGNGQNGDGGAGGSGAGNTNPPIYPDPAMDCQGCLQEYNPEFCNYICNPPQEDPNLPLHISLELQGITNTFSPIIYAKRSLVNNLSDLMDSFQYEYANKYQYFIDNGIKFNWVTEQEFIENFQQDAEGYVMQNDRNIQYVKMGNEHYMLIKNQYFTPTYEHLIQEMQLAYYQEPNNTYDAGVTNVTIDVSDLENHPKAKCIYEKLVASGTLKSFLTQFDNRTGFLDLVIQVAPIEQNHPSGFLIDANTNYNSASNKFIITIDESRLMVLPTVDIARIIMHESIHAQLLGYLYQCLQIPSERRNEFIKNNFYGLYDYLTRFNGAGNTPNSPQHALMSAHYVDIMVQKLMIYDNTLTLDDATALAWQGLIGTVGWDLLPASTKQNIEDNYEYIRLMGIKTCN